VTGGVAEENREPAVGKRNEVVDVAADGIGDAIERGDLVLVRLRRRLRNQIGLQVAREFEFIANLILSISSIARRMTMIMNEPAISKKGQAWKLR